MIHHPQRKSGKNAASFCLTLLLLLSSAGCVLRPSSAEEAESLRREESRVPETEPPETVPINPPPPITEWTGETGESETDAPDPSGNPSSAGSLLAAGGKYWSFEDGKCVYRLPARDESALWPIEEMYDIPKDPWSDQPGDWYGPKWTYDEATGEAVMEYNRAEDTLNSVKKRHAIYLGDTSRKVAYITFDGGFDKGTTALILDTLKEKEVPASFFINSWYLETASDMVRRMLDEGHIVGNHCVNHEMLTTVTSEVFLSEVRDLADQFETKFPDAPQMIYFRPPGGNCNDWVLRFAEKLGYTTVLWSWTYADYDDEDQPDLGVSFDKLKSGLHPGCVYFFHTNSTTTVSLLPLAIDWIRSQGYEILPICDIEP